MNQPAVDGLRVERRDAGMWVVLDRPHRRNALTLDLAGALIDALSDPPDDVRAVVLTGTGPAFCSGGDRADLVAVAAQGPIAVTDVVYARFQGLVRAIAAAEVPVIAAVNGPALGAGFDLALACDLRVAATEATFDCSWVKVGLVPGMGGAHMLTRTVGATRAAELVLLGRPIGAREALEWGLVNAVVPADDLIEHVSAMVATLASRSRPALARAKAALRRARDAGMAEEFATLGAVQSSLAAALDLERWAKVRP
ncbi:2-(1,2-epoxy-1,2-dihydrophenyl)acetyl-CoA isomerase [Thermocatellispora tengchongensis]|uniref:2-(1,2-epoxy-1,2-dihydrophenyl)acetyl-CoA isomerase n=1 Tax=Thermocatellispora tengchongensis TaxID=1073253 RepID=A0A840PC63_9ACTN|nr:enoyl-CoA hydratase/isomerase family protein [Thermocatellispora tengchongensis]MBB5136276.1 2-(1,2-epoxy-1,2-dihydrophenyl)acetyl-CoA isomerase [Thermocatellispora tengchongensis]